MLVLTRTVGKSADIMDADGKLLGKVFLVQVRGKQQARLGFAMNDDIGVFRSEIDATAREINTRNHRNKKASN